MPSALHQVEVVSRGVGSAAEDGDHDAQPHHNFSGGHHQHKEHQHLPSDVVEHVGKGHKRQVGGGQHQLHTHEHHQHIATDEEPEGADGEKDRSQRQIPLTAYVPIERVVRSDHGVTSWWASSVAGAESSTNPSSGSGSGSGSRSRSGAGAVTTAGGLRASATAPTTAITSSAEVTSNGKR